MHFFHAFDPLGDLHGAIDLCLRFDKSAELDSAFLGFDVDVQAFHIGRLKQRRFDFCSKGRIVDLLAKRAACALGRTGPGRGRLRRKPRD